jgi:ribosome-associated heat shock protein Hsp15
MSEVRARDEHRADAHLRIDKWLWYARFFKTRSGAAKLCNGSKVRAAGVVVSKAHHRLRVGDVLTFPQGRHIRVVKVLALGQRRGPAADAQRLYEDLKPPEPANRLPPRGGGAATAWRAPGSGRPTKRDRRALERMKGEN